MTTFERTYLSIWQRRFLILLGAHILLAAAVSYYFGTQIKPVLMISFIIVIGPLAMYLVNRGGHLTSIAIGIACVSFSGLLIHASGGMVEFHFHIFAVLGVLIAFGRPAPIVAAALVIALHHLLFYLFLPASVFNYQASIGIVILHAAFVRQSDCF